MFLLYLPSYILLAFQKIKNFFTSVKYMSLHWVLKVLIIWGKTFPYFTLHMFWKKPRKIFIILNLSPKYVNMCKFL